MSATPKPIDTSDWVSIDQGVYIEKFVATAVFMPNQVNPVNPSERLIHWRGAGAYQVIRDSKIVWRSTSFDTRKLTETDPIVQVQFISKDFDVSSRAAGHWQIPLAKWITTTQVKDHILSYGLDRYYYNGDGSGCLTWTTKLVEILEKENVLPSGSKASFLAKVDEIRNYSNCWVPTENGSRFFKEGEILGV